MVIVRLLKEILEDIGGPCKVVAACILIIKDLHKHFFLFSTLSFDRQDYMQKPMTLKFSSSTSVSWNLGAAGASSSDMWILLLFAIIRHLTDQRYFAQHKGGK
jgi:hypothetical protein